jgi:multimeric flavodoxin WrbA
MHGNKKYREKKGRRYKMSEQDKSFFDRLLSSDGYSEEDKVREYISHRIRNGANLRGSAPRRIRTP